MARPAPDPGSARLALRVVPNSKRSALVGRHGEAFKVKIAAPAVDGKANAALAAFLAEALGVRESAVRLVSGASSRDKVVEVAGLPAGEAARRLAAAERP